MSQTLRAFECRDCDERWYSTSFIRQAYLCPVCGKVMTRVTGLYKLVAEDNLIVEAKPKNTTTTIALDKQLHDIIKQEARAKGVTIQAHVRQIVLRQ